MLCRATPDHMALRGTRHVVKVAVRRIVPFVVPGTHAPYVGERTPRGAEGCRASPFGCANGTKEFRWHDFRVPGQRDRQLHCDDLPLRPRHYLLPRCAFMKARARTTRVAHAPALPGSPSRPPRTRPTSTTRPGYRARYQRWLINIVTEWNWALACGRLREQRDSSRIGHRSAHASQPSLHRDWRESVHGRPTAPSVVAGQF